jgi:hypothetical protein
VNFIAAGYSVDAQDLVVINHVVSLAVLECLAASLYRRHVSVCWICVPGPLRC